MLENADFHIHSPFSMAVSPAMTPAAVLDVCTLKGISVLGSGDALHPAWRAAWEDSVENDAGIIVVPTVEVAAEGRVHHLILMEDFDACAELGRRLEPFGRTVRSAGRPHVALGGEALAGMVHDLGGLIGPAHAFTPWTGMYAAFDHVHECYGSERIDLLELGLSADSSYGAGIADLRDVVFLTNSDAHSPVPEKLGREFNRLRIRERSVRGVLRAVRSGAVGMNAGFFPDEGKYNRTACTRCYRQYSAEEARDQHWRCPDDGGRIKKGVFDRSRELTAGAPTTRPPYLHIIPLGEIIRTCLKTSTPRTKRCRDLYRRLIADLGTEIEVLVDVPIERIRAVDAVTADAIAAFRAGEITLYPGGGGKYGTFSIGTVCRDERSGCEKSV
jgi:uncharacterized protein (TIGR00375 family)